MDCSIVDPDPQGSKNFLPDPDSELKFMDADPAKDPELDLNLIKKLRFYIDNFGIKNTVH
jgi:hypothetical protein